MKKGYASSSQIERDRILRRKLTVLGLTVLVSIIFFTLAYRLISRIEGPDAQETTAVTTTQAQAELGAAATVPTVSVELEGEFSCLLAACDAAGELSLLSGVEVDLSQGRAEVFAIPLDMTFDATARSFSQIFKQEGMKQLCSAVSECYGVEYSKSILMTEKNFSKAVSKLGAVTVEVKKAISFTHESISLQLVAGEQGLGADKLMSYMKYGESGNALLELQATTISAILQQYFTLKNIEKGESLFAYLVNLAQTDITAFDYAEHYDILRAVAEKGMSFEDCGILRPQSSQANERDAEG